MESNGGRVRVRRSAAQWRRLIAEQAAGEFGVGQFCRERGLATSSFCNWKRKLWEAGAREAAPAGFVELAVPAAPAREADWDVELEIGNDIVLRVRRR